MAWDALEKLIDGVTKTARENDGVIDAGEYSTTAGEYVEAAKNLNKDQFDLASAIDKIDIPGDGTTVNAARDKLAQLRRAAHQTQECFDVLRAAAEDHKASVDKFHTTVNPLDLQKAELTRQLRDTNAKVIQANQLGVAVTYDPPVTSPNTVTIGGPGGAMMGPPQIMRAPQSINDEIIAIDKKIQAAVNHFNENQLDIRGRVQNLDWTIGMGMNHRPGEGPSNPSSVPMAPGTPAPTGSVPLFPGSPMAPSATSPTTSPDSPTSNTDAADILAAATPLEAQAANPMQNGTPNAQTAGLPMTAMPGQNVNGTNPQQQQQSGPKQLSDEEFQNLLNNARGPGKSKVSDTPVLDPTSPSTITTGAPLTGTTPHPPSLMNVTSEPDAAKTGGPRTTTAAGPSSNRSQMPMMMPPMAGAPGASPGPMAAGKSDRPKIANADPKDIYGDEKKRTTDPIISPRRLNNE